MRILVKPRFVVSKALKEYEAKNKKLWNAYNIISIYCPGNMSPFEECKSGWVLKLAFDDVEPRELGTLSVNTGMPWTLMDTDQAEQIATYARDLEKNSKRSKLPLIVHCDAGKSRSAAVGLVLNHYFNFRNGNTKDYEEFLNMHRNALWPNNHVGKLVTEAIYGTEVLWENIREGYTGKEDWLWRLD